MCFVMAAYRGMLLQYAMYKELVDNDAIYDLTVKRHLDCKVIEIQSGF